MTYDTVFFTKPVVRNAEIEYKILDTCDARKKKRAMLGKNIQKEYELSYLLCFLVEKKAETYVLFIKTMTADIVYVHKHDM